MKPERIHAHSVKYGFNQSLTAPAEEAFDWCTDYQPYDLTTMKEEGKRGIRKITDDLIILTESMRKNKKRIKKTKLVRLNKSDLSWTNTHISGPNRHSQFLYKIVPEGKTHSRLYFKGLLVCYSPKPLTRKELATITEQERSADSKAWRHLAAALRRETAQRSTNR